MNNIPVLGSNGKDYLPEAAKMSSSSQSLNTDHEETKLTIIIKEFYRRWAYFIANNYILAIIIPIALSAIFSIKLLRTPYENDPIGHLPYGARGRTEYLIQQAFSEQNGKGVFLMLLVVPKDNSSVLNVDILKEAVQINEIVMNNFTIENHITGLKQTFSEFCTNYCFVNEPVRIFYNTFSIQEELYKSGKPLNDRINLEFPVSTIYGQELNLQMNFNGVKLVNNASQQKNGSTVPIASVITNMNTVKMITLLYRAEWIGNWTDNDVRHFELSVVDFFEREYKAERVRISILSFFYVDSEVTRGGLSMLPYLTLGFAIMSACSTISTILSALYMGQFSYHKIYLAILACICPLMANVTAIGMLIAIGVRYGSILCITPFLVLAIGVDDAYLMIHAWQRVARSCKESPKKDDNVAYRLAEVLMETGPAILISALTNILADIVGTFTGSPEITILCYGNMASIFMDYIYQLTFYSAIMCIAGRREIEYNNNELVHSITIDNDRKEAIRCCSNCDVQKKVKKHCKTFLHGYVKFVTNGCVAFTILFLWALFIAFSIKGISQIRIGLSTEKLFPHDSPLIEVRALMQKVDMFDCRIVDIEYKRDCKFDLIAKAATLTNRLISAYRAPQYTMVQFYVNNPGNLSDQARLDRLYQTLVELENLNESWGSQSTNFFLRDFTKYEYAYYDVETNVSSNTSTLLYNENDLRSFLDWPEYKKWRGFIRLNAENGSLEKFFFTTAYHGDKLVEWSEKSKLLREWRNVIDKHKDLNITMFNEDALFVDLIDNMPTDAWQSAVGIIISMAFISFIFLYDKFTVLVVSLAILSIMAGMIGIVSWMDVDLEPIMMAAMLISMGFSVDIPAHVAYHYNSAGKSLTVEQRLRKCFASVALPAIQATLSTNLCVLGLALIPLYMAQVFVKMMVSCITLCLVHGLVIIPCTFALTDVILRFLLRKRRKFTITESS